MLEIEFQGRGEQKFRTKIVGVTFNNKDGTNRQELLKKCRIHQKVFLERDYNNEHDLYAIKVFNVSHKQLGYIPSDSRLASHMDCGGIVSAEIVKITGRPYRSIIDRLFGLKKEKKNLGCIIEITKNFANKDQKAIEEEEEIERINLKIIDLIREAESNEKENPKTSISLYETAVEKIKQLDDYSYEGRASRLREIPINRLTLLLERQKKYDLAVKYLHWYESYRD